MVLAADAALDELLTLEEALALLDTPTDLLLDTPTDLLLDTPTNLLLDLDVDVGDSASSNSPKRRAKRAKTATSESVGSSSSQTSSPSADKPKKVYVRRDPRKEIATLQHETQELEERLALLRRHSAICMVAASSHPGDDAPRLVPIRGADRWAERSLREFQRREESERTNETLRAALARQERVSSMLSAILHGETAASEIHEETALVSRPSAHEIRFPAPDDHYKLFTELYHYLEALYYNTALALDKVGSANPAFATSSSQRHDPALGLVVEMASSTPVMCEFAKLEKLLWARMLANTMTHECHQFENRQKRRVAQTSDCVEKHLHMTFSDKHGPMTLGGISVTRKFAEQHRTVFVLTTRIHCAERNVQLREDSWLIVSAVGDAASTSRFQCFHRSYVDRASRARATSDARDLQDFLVRSSSERVHEHQMLMLRLLTEEFGPSPAGVVSAPHPQIQLAAV